MDGLVHVFTCSFLTKVHVPFFNVVSAAIKTPQKMWYLKVTKNRENLSIVFPRFVFLVSRILRFENKNTYFNLHISASPSTIMSGNLIYGVLTFFIIYLRLFCVLGDDKEADVYMCNENNTMNS